MQRPTEIKGLSEIRRLPRLGKIRLGEKRVSKETGNEYPAEVDYFVVPPEVAKVYGDKPKELDVVFPVDDESIIAPYAYEYYGSSKGLKCTGTGEYANELNEQTGAIEKRTCPCEKLEQKKCKQRMHLRVILPRVNIGGVYQIDTSSFNSIVDIRSGLQWVKCATTSPEFPHGRLAWIPLKLRREATETHYEGKKQIHYTLKLFLNSSMETLESMVGKRFVLPAPECKEEEGNNDTQDLPPKEIEILKKYIEDGLEAQGIISASFFQACTFQLKIVMGAWEIETWEKAKNFLEEIGDGKRELYQDGEQWKFRTLGDTPRSFGAFKLPMGQVIWEQALQKVGGDSKLAEEELVKASTYTGKKDGREHHLTLKDLQDFDKQSPQATKLLHVIYKKLGGKDIEEEKIPF